ncbi:S8 family serine peptidase [uncultured Polaribacter sp.]|uniref:S8 family serine peptidase n=1 Tax=uncultured Polaribacter sp. TaxID=174711 RepID=UPI0026045DD1|nr:S8 family serine peptidase [uncultured Polaribacter sp.]
MIKIKNSIVLLMVFISFFSCKEVKHMPIRLDNKLLLKNKELESLKDFKSWYLKDIEIDTVPGVSLQRAYDSLLINKKGKEVIIAVIDTEVDINHEELKNNIWINNDEIPNNQIDDDYNGYIDDINGWNFLGNLKGQNIIYSSTESVRIIRFYKNKFNNKKKEDVPVDKHEEFDLFIKAKTEYDKNIKRAKSDLEYGDFLFYGYPKAKEAMKNLFLREDYTPKELDSVYKKYKKINNPLAKHAYFISDFIKYNLTEDWVNNYKKNAENKINTIYNLEYYDRKDIDENPSDITFKNYGNPFINKNINKLYHGTLIAGLISADRDNHKGIKGISNLLKIMPLAISSNGTEHDKDVALAIKYAVDNGAKVINMSFGKELSLHKQWVFDAIQYAEEKNVLIISSAGNLGKNLNSNDYFPNDNIKNGAEITDNFMLIGSSSFNLNIKLLSYYSNYGDNDVDLFAPGQKIYTTLPNNKYKFESGTSLASAITSGVAGLIRSYYPNLTAPQIKHILMDSGLEYTLEVSTPTKEEKNKTTPFNQLSKSGKVLNAYNALIMADSISKN